MISTDSILYTYRCFSCRRLPHYDLEAFVWKRYILVWFGRRNINKFSTKYNKNQFLAFLISFIKCELHAYPLKIKHFKTIRCVCCSFTTGCWILSHRHIWYTCICKDKCIHVKSHTLPIYVTTHIGCVTRWSQKTCAKVMYIACVSHQLGSHSNYFWHETFELAWKVSRCNKKCGLVWYIWYIYIIQASFPIWLPE